MHSQPNSCFVTNSMHPKLRQDGLSGTKSVLMLGVLATDIQHVSISGWVYLWISKRVCGYVVCVWVSQEAVLFLSSIFESYKKKKKRESEREKNFFPPGFTTQHSCWMSCPAYGADGHAWANADLQSFSEATCQQLDSSVFSPESSLQCLCFALYTPDNETCGRFVTVML